MHLPSYTRSRGLHHPLLVHSNKEPHAELITYTAKGWKPVIDTPEVAELTVTETKLDEDSFVYVHCHFQNKWQDMLIRIWKTSYLIDHSSDHRSKLVHIENITYAPQWTPVRA